MRILWRHFSYHIGQISRGIFHMFLLRTSWYDDIGNSRAAFLIALIVNVLAVPLGAWFSLFDDKNADLTLQGRLVIEAIILMVTLIAIFLMALCRLRVQQFPVIYAGITYSGLMIALILVLVEGGMSLYDQSLYGQSVPLLAHALLLAALLWMVILTAFIFKTALKIGVAASIMMTAMLFFVIISGRYILGLLWLHFFNF